MGRSSALRRSAHSHVVQLVVRHCVRALLVDDAERLLLLRGESHGEGFWFAIGGGIEPGETAVQALIREVREETGVRLPAGVALSEVWHRRHVVPWCGRMHDLRERWFLVRVPAVDVDTSGFTETERDMVTGHRWWTLDDLACTSERLTPADLAERLARLLRNGPPSAPVEVGV